MPSSRGIEELEAEWIGRGGVSKISMGSVDLRHESIVMCVWVAKICVYG